MMLIEKTAVPSAALPLGELKDHLRFGTGFGDDGFQDGVLESHLRAAIAAIEARTGKALVEREFEWTLSRWRHDARQPLLIAPINAITEVILRDAVGGDVLASTTTYRLEPDAHRPKLAATGTALPRIPQNGLAVISFLAGYGAELQDVPADLGHAVITLAAHYYEYRHGTVHGSAALPASVSAAIEPYRTVRLFSGGER